MPPKGKPCAPFRPERFAPAMDIGRPCVVEGYEASPGKLVFLGPHHKNGKARAGVILRDAIGKNNGNVAGFKYFECKKNHGVLVSLNKIMFVTMMPMTQQQMMMQQQAMMQKAAAKKKPKRRASMKAAEAPFRRQPIYESFPDIVPGTKITKKKKTRAAWYVGVSTREELDLAVLAADSGDFLVRLDTARTSYVVCVNDNKKSTHSFKVKVNGGSLLFQGKDYDTMEDVVEALRRDPITTKSGAQVFLADSASQCNYFVGRMDPDAVDKMLLAAGHCDYLVRTNSACDNYVLAVNDNGIGKSFKVTKMSNGKLKCGEKKHHSLSDLIDYYMETPLQGNTGKIFLKKPACSAPWYVGEMGRAATEKAVLKAKAGDYLLRLGSKANSYVLCVNDHGAAKNFQISRDPMLKSFSFGGKTFTNMEMVVRSLKATPLTGRSGELKIGKPAPRPMDKFEETGAELDRDDDDIGGGAGSGSDYDDYDAGGGGGGSAASGGGGGGGGGFDDDDGFGDGSNFDFDNFQLGGMNMAEIDARIAKAKDGGGDAGDESEELSGSEEDETDDDDDEDDDEEEYDESGTDEDEDEEEGGGTAIGAEITDDMDEAAAMAAMGLEGFSTGDFK